MDWDAWFTLAVVAGTVYALARDVLAPSVAMVGAMVVLLVAGVIDPTQALAGFSSQAPMTVAALYIVARAVEKTGGLQPLLASTLGEGRGVRMPLVRLLIPAAGASAFLNNTPIVAMLLQPVTQWCERRGLSPSRFLMPLSFAAILGGVITLIGTSTNIVVSGLLEASGHGGLGMFEMTHVGLPVALIGIFSLVILAPVLLPARRGARQDIAEAGREFVVSMRVEVGGPLDGKAVQEGGLRHLQGVFLVEVEREGDREAPVGPDFVLKGGDILTFVGRADLIVDLQTMRGLASAEAKHLDDLDSPSHTFFEVVIGEASPLMGRTVRDVRFREQYQAAVLAIHRSGRRVDAKIGEVELRVGDTLLLLSDPGFQRRWRDRGDFLLVSRLGGTTPAATRKAWIAGLLTIGVVVVAGAGLLPILQASLVAAILTVVFGVLTPGEARSAVDLDVILLIAASFGVGAAIETSGLANAVANGLLATFGGLGPRGTLLGIVLTTVLLTELITNNAAAVLVFPVGLVAGAAAGLDPHTVAIAIAIAASASFLTPIGYQTNTMVYGPGGYRFGDYARLGAPLTVVVIVAVVILT
ncbi:MAG: SLC13 family permease [Gemmatimonadales bacterium]